MPVLPNIVLVHGAWANGIKTAEAVAAAT